MHSISGNRFRSKRLGFPFTVAIEALECRTLMSVVTVNTLSDTATGQGVVTISDAIAMANTSTSPTSIDFDPSVFATAQTLDLAGNQLELSNAGQPIAINGPGAGVTINGGGATRVFFVDPGVTASFDHISLQDGNAQSNNGDGGGIYVSSGAQVTMNQVTISNCRGVDGSHGGGLANYGTVNLNSTIFSNNTVTAHSGGTTAGQGGGLYNAGTLTFQSGAITGNSAVMGGGGIYNTGTITVNQVSITANTSSQGFGGGMENQPADGGSASATLTNDTLSGNSGPAGGGIASNLSSSQSGTVSMALRNDTVANNTAYQSGGGVWLDSANTGASIVGCTIVGNTAGSGGGGLLTGAGGIAVGNSIIAGNSGSGGNGPDVSGTIGSEGHNFIGESDNSSGWVGSDLTGSLANPISAVLGSLANNGGSTQTLLPLPGSPLIGAGAVGLIPPDITTDQRGLLRIYNGKVDIGSVEIQPTTASTTVISASGSSITAGQPIQFTATVSGTASTPTGTVTFLDNGTSIGTAPLISGKATFSTTSLPVGTDNITATYAGDYTYVGSVSTATAVTVLHGALVASSSTLSASADIFPVGDHCTLTCTVAIQTGTGPVPTGTVTIQQNGAAKGTATLGANGTVAVQLDASSTAAGAPVYFVYSGDSNYSPSTSNTITQSYPALSPLSAAIKRATSPKANIAGQPLNAKVTAAFTNTGGTLGGTYTIALHADTSTGGLSGNQVALQTITKRLNLKAGKSFSLTLAAKALPKTLPAGTYYLTVVVTDPNNAVNLVTATQTITVTAPSIVLSATAGAVKPATISAGKSASLVITITNKGNITATSSGANPLAILLTPTTVPGSTLAISTPHLAIKPGRSATYTLHFKIPASLPAGTYSPQATVSFEGLSTNAVGSQFTVG